MRDSYALFQKRVYVFTWIMVCLFCALIARMVYLQLIEGDRFHTLSDDNRLHVRLLFPTRGEVYDRNGVALAHNKTSYQAVLLRQNMTLSATRQLLENVQPVLGLSDATITAFSEKVQKHPRHIPFPLKSDLTWEEVAALEVFHMRFPNVEVVEALKRYYPKGEALAHVLGYVTTPHAADIGEDPSLAMPEAVIGRTGIEKQYDTLLRGQAGKEVLEVNAAGRGVRVLNTDQALKGQAVTLTLDVRLQEYVYRLLSAYKSAAAVVLDIHTGEVLAMVSVPTFDPNKFVAGMSHAEWQKLSQLEGSAMTNKIIAGLYSPASIMKLVVALAAHDQKTDLENFCPVCAGHITVGGHKFHCWKRGGHGGMTLQNALKRSCDVYFYELAQKLGSLPILRMGEKLGLNQLSHIDLPGERKGFLPSKQWKKQKLGEGWYVGDTILLSIGQGHMQTTPLSWATLMAQIANGGYAIQPHLHKQVGMLPPKQKILPEAARRLLLKVMDETVNHPKGTGYKSRIKEPGFEMGGKTATSQVRRIKLKERQQGVRRGEDLPWALRDNSLFIGFAPVHRPRYAVAVLIEHGGWGSATAAPVGRDILHKTQKLLMAEQGGARG